MSASPPSKGQGSFAALAEADTLPSARGDPGGQVPLEGAAPKFYSFPRWAVLPGPLATQGT